MSRTELPTLPDLAVAAPPRRRPRFVGDSDPPPRTVTIEQARADGRAWAEMTARDGGAAGPWGGTLADVRILPGYDDAPDDIVTACQAAATERWRELAADAAIRRLEAANKHAERLLERLAAAADHSSPRLVGVSTVQLPIVAPGLETPHGPLLVTLETWSGQRGVWYKATLPLLGNTRERSNADDALRALHDDIVLYAQPNAGGVASEHKRALAALVRRVAA